MNVQLLKTSPYLSGQQKLDVCLNRVDDDLVTGKCRFTPLSSAISYTDSNERPFFNYSYQDNLKWLKRKIERDFYSDIPDISSNDVIYDNDVDFVDIVDHTYNCGMKRMRYQTYSKQFSWLCPMWIEDAELINRLSFKLTIYGDDTYKITAIDNITLSPDLKKSLYKYLHEPKVSSKLLTINYEKETAFIYGLNPTTGAMCEVDVSYIVPQLLERERPILETNSTLNQLFASNDLIARQLINFNFCFNPEDIVGAHILESMYFKRWKVIIEAYDGDEKIPLKDFYTNYDFIPSYMVVADEGKIFPSKNVLSYLQDNNYIDYSLLNKSTQPDVYWSLTENPKYIYNLYNGFSSWYKDYAGANHQVQGVMYSQPDCAHHLYSEQYNNIGWCKVYNFSTYNFDNAKSKMTQLITVGDNNETLTKFYKADGTNNIIWVNGLKYIYRANISSPIYVAIALYSGAPTSFIQVEDIPNPERVIVIFVPNFPEYKDVVTIKSLSSGGAHNIIDRTSGGFTYLSNILTCLVPPDKITFRKSIIPIKAPSPSLESEEITYIKREYNVNSFVYRYSGDLRPYFIDPNDKDFYNVLWKFKTYTDKDFQKSNYLSNDSYIIDYYENIKKGYSPEFKSIGFFPLESDTSSDGKIDYYKYIPYYDKNISSMNPTGGNEFSWWMDSRFYFLPQKVENIVFDSPTNSKISDEEFIEKLYTLDFRDKYLARTVWDSQIKKLYDCDISYDYKSETNINTLTFNCKYTLR